MSLARPVDLLTRYPAAYRAKIHAQARKLAEVMADALPGPERGELGRAHWEDLLYELILAECSPERLGPFSRQRVDELERGGGER